MSRRLRIAGLTLAVACAWAAPAEASHGKIDRVEKSNGDVVTCEVVGLTRGRMKIKTDGMGTITVEWPKVVRVASPAQFEVELSSGLEYFGSLSAPAAGQLAVSGAPAGVAFDLSTVVRITPIDARFWQQLDGSIDAGYTFTQADERSQWSLNAKIGRTRRRYITTFNVSSLLTVEDAGTRQSRNTVNLALQRTLGRHWFAAVFGQTDQNEQLGLDFRALGGASAGRWLVRTNRVLFAPYLGGTYTQERYTGEPVRNRSELVTGARFDWFTFGNNETDLVTQEQTYFDVEDWSGIRVELNTSFRQEIVRDLFWSLNLLESFNTKPPENKTRNDLTLSMTLGWTF